MFGKQGRVGSCGSDDTESRNWLPVVCLCTYIVAGTMQSSLAANFYLLSLSQSDLPLPVRDVVVKAKTEMGPLTLDHLHTHSLSEVLAGGAGLEAFLEALVYVGLLSVGLLASLV